MCGGLIREVAQVLRKRWAYLQEGLHAGGGGLIAGEIRHVAWLK